jgi:hypothetical protein
MTSAAEHEIAREGVGPEPTEDAAATPAGEEVVQPPAPPMGISLINEYGPAAALAGAWPPASRQAAMAKTKPVLSNFMENLLIDQQSISAGL